MKKHTHTLRSIDQKMLKLFATIVSPMTCTAFLVHARSTFLVFPISTRINSERETRNSGTIFIRYLSLNSVCIRKFTGVW